MLWERVECVIFLCCSVRRSEIKSVSDSGSVSGSRPERHALVEEGKEVTRCFY